jgi:hypothetical protein
MRVAALQNLNRIALFPETTVGTAADPSFSIPLLTHEPSRPSKSAYVGTSCAKEVFEDDLDTQNSSTSLAPTAYRKGLTTSSSLRSSSTLIAGSVDGSAGVGGMLRWLFEGSA